ncbi:MAG: hypothetical protein OEW16_09565, partial [Gammaproteobacteria bacterium]|nr:hypothetical protein [Gammaproteobacteria bacterium]
AIDLLLSGQTDDSNPIFRNDEAVRVGLRRYVLEDHSRVRKTTPHIVESRCFTRCRLQNAHAGPDPSRLFRREYFVA